MKKFTLIYKKLLLSLAFLCSITLGIGQSIFENPITDSNPSATNPFILGQVVDANITVVGIGRGTGINPNIGLNRYNARDWNLTTLDANDYFYFTITPNLGFEIDFVNFTYTGQASGTGPVNVAFRSSLDGYVADIGAPTVTGTTIDLSAIPYQNITGSITFRAYAWGGSNTAGTFSINDFTFDGIVSPTCLSTVTWDGANWTPATGPNSTTEVIINANYDTSTDLPGSFNACSLTVNAGVLNIQGTDYVTIENDITIDGTITIASEASLVQVNDLGSVTVNAGGDGILQKTTTILTDWYDYTYWSSPVSNETIGSVFGLVPSNRIFEYNAANFEDGAPVDGFDDDANDWSIASGTMTQGKGYAAVAENNVFPFPQNNTMSFNGIFNNGVITPTITMSPGPNPKHWNFLGNPYPSPIDADLFIMEASNVTNLAGTLYFWVHNLPPDGANPGNEGQNFSVDDYATYNMSGGTAAATSGGNIPTGIIATGQGFFVEALSAGTAVFNNSMRVNTGNDNFYRTSDRIWLNFKNDYGAFSQILIGFNENATDGYDRLYDGKRLDAGSYVSFVSFIEDEKYGIQSKAPIAEEELIPLGIMTTIEGETEFSISIDNIEGILEKSEVYLLDNYLNFEHNLNESAYTFTTLNGEFNDRFSLSLKTDIRLINPSLENELIISSNDGNQELRFSTTQLSNITNVQIFDMLGRLRYNVGYKAETKEASLRMSETKNTIYIANVILENGKVLTKKIIN